MDDATGVAVVERFGHLDADIDDVAELAVLSEERAQVRALHQRHHEVEGVLVPAKVVDGDDGRMVHLRHQLRFALEALLRLGAELRRRDQLDRDVTIEPRIPGAVHHAHAAASELRDDLVAVGQFYPKHLRSGSPRGLQRPSWKIR